MAGDRRGDEDLALHSRDGRRGDRRALQHRPERGDPPGVKIGDNVEIENNVSMYAGVILDDDVFGGPTLVFTNVMNPRSHVSRKHEYRQRPSGAAPRWVRTHDRLRTRPRAIRVYGCRCGGHPRRSGFRAGGWQPGPARRVDARACGVKLTPTAAVEAGRLLRCSACALDEILTGTAIGSVSAS